MSEIHGVWLANRPHSQVLASKQNITEAIAFLNSKGFNFIFPVVWNRGYTLFTSQVMGKYNFPVLDPYYQQQQREPLAEIITVAHQYNIKVIPWFEYGFAASHLLSGGHILQQKPHWKAVNQDGATVRHGSLTWMNALNPEVQQFMQELILEVVVQYDIDGIQGCDRLPALPVTAGYNTKTQQQYQRQCGRQAPPNCKDRHWVQWRADILTEFLATLYRQVKTAKPQLIFSLSPGVYPFCWENLLQDSKTWVEKGLVDLIHPQIYRSSFFSYRQEVQKIVNMTDKDLRHKFAPGIALTANGKDLSVRDVMQYIQLNRSRNFSGEVFFHYEGLRKNNDEIPFALKESGIY
ncbi:MAG: glycoside hydrolase family 10 protein [Pleurocapsa sp.]